MMTIAQAVANLTANPRPVLFLDTCALLDIVRATLRNLTPTVQAGLELRTLAGVGTVQLFVQDIVPGEWTDNLPSARKDGEAGILAFTATWELAHEFGQPSPPLPALPPGTLIDELEKLSKDLLDAAEVIERDFDGMSLAIGRVAAKLKPSSGKGPVKDCHILCHALRLSDELRVAGYPRWRVLVSSNRSDFAAPNATVFHQDIDNEATAAELRYAVSLEAAVADLKAAGEIPP
ncbi:MAG: hypothetical protein ACLQIB_34730 [Isosphaeraceae bacterium]